MNKKTLIPAGVGIGVIIVAIALIASGNNETQTIQEPENQPSTLSFSYIDTNKDLQSTLDLQQIRMSSPLKLNGFSIEQYCTFFSDEALQKSIEYCTSTELLDSQGQYLGNIHMVGAPSEPWYVIGVIQTNPTVSQLDEIKAVYRTMIESTVCECWEDESPGGFESVSDWIDAANSHHLEAERITSKSEISGIAQKNLLLEITTNTEGYLWKFIIPVHN
ncbi:MAG: hypothetical protein H2B01_08865 [Nitrosopumilaceae archaeon]|uniref:Uncharacterized protein n=1 Tax=Candidatus Nitrosomaritimum aestuariumsis TaxID=3342354 RepID=A0AC60WBI0_9ARCH|nr:hypothetical protein [Nitrosopumilaceae archaeon]